VHTNSGTISARPSVEDGVALLKALVRPEEWGEAWPVMLSCLKCFDPARGELSHLFLFAWKRRRIDLLRRESRRVATCGGDAFERVNGVVCENTVDDRDEMETRLRALRETIGEKRYEHLLLAFRVPWEGAALALNMPLGTFKSNFSRYKYAAQDPKKKTRGKSPRVA
jgi:hypothetical protein